MTAFVQLRTGARIPIIGFGTYRITDSQTILNCLDAALESGYRFIDTAQMYTNEGIIGDALIKLLPNYALQRKDVFITSKLSSDNMSAEKVRPTVEQSLRDLRTDYIDLLLIHQPKPAWLDNNDPKCKDARRECWSEMEKLHAEGKLRAIGVSNFELRHIDEMSTYASVQPAVNQCEFHPHYCRRDLVNGMKERGIHFQAFTSLGRNNPDLMSEPVLVELAQKYNVPVSHILLAWPMLQGISVLPKSANPGRVRDNFMAVRVKLTDEEIEKIWGLHKGVNYTLCRPWETV